MLTDETYARYLESQEERRKRRKRPGRRPKTPRRQPLPIWSERGANTSAGSGRSTTTSPRRRSGDKLDSLETVCQQIFAYVADHPDKLPAIRKFISYYLPTTLSSAKPTISSTGRIPASRANRRTMQEILSALGNIDLAFHNLLDDLMETSIWTSRPTFRSSSR